MSPSATLAEPRQPTRSRRESARSGDEAALIWSIASLAQYALTVSVAAIVCTACWYNMSGKAVFARQVPAINIAVVALVISSGAGISLLLAGRRAIGLRRQALLGQPAALATTVASAPVVPQQRGASPLVGGEGLTHFHRSDCAMAAERGWSVADRAVHIREGRSACGVCKP
jgi:hypothetical protein